MNGKMFLILFSICFTLFISAQRAMGQNLRNLTLKEAMDLVIKNSKQLKGGQARIAEATASIREATDRRLPDVKISGAYMHLNSPNVNLKVGKDSGTNGSNGQSSNAKVSQAAYGIANLSIPIYSGFRIQYGIESAK